MRIIENLDLTNYNSYRIKSICKRAVFFDKAEDIILYYKENPITPRVIIGSGNNLILSKDYYEEDFIIFNGNFSKISKQDGGIISAEAGAMMSTVSENALKCGLSGLEVFYDIPSSVGGAVSMNAGANNEEIKNVLIKVRYFDINDLSVKEIYREDIEFDYRDSMFLRNKKNIIILNAWFVLAPRSKVKIKQKMEQIKQKRWAKQPREYPSAGSVFKRPSGYYVGTLIEELGMKGFSIGGAKISEKHAGFIINYDNATGKDIINIIIEVQERVAHKYGINLQVEQIII